MYQNLKSKKGVYILEGTILIPVFVISLIFIIKIVPTISNFERGVFVATNNLRLASIESYKLKEDKLLCLKSNIELKKDKNYNLFPVKIFPYKYDYSKKGINHLVTWTYFGKSNNKLLLENIIPFVVKGKITGRLFIGKSNLLDPDKNLNGDYESVYIFPNYGTKFHKKDCNYIDVDLKSKSLTYKIKREMKSCKICHSNKVKIGEVIYLIGKNTYHLKKCSLLNRYYVKIEKDRAKKEGYKSCIKCRG